MGMCLAKRCLADSHGFQASCHNIKSYLFDNIHSQNPRGLLWRGLHSAAITEQLPSVASDPAGAARNRRSSGTVPWGYGDVRVPMEVHLKSTVSWDVKTCSLVEAYFLDSQGLRVKQEQAGGKVLLSVWLAIRT
jgi:hypothetical protein